MVEHDTKVVNSIAYYEGEVWRQFFDEANPDGYGTSVSIRLDAKSVRFRRHKRGELPFQVRDVMIGPFKF